MGKDHNNGQKPWAGDLELVNKHPSSLRYQPIMGQVFEVDGVVLSFRTKGRNPSRFFCVEGFLTLCTLCSYQS